MNTYKEIQKYVQKKYHRTVKTCWIAHVKELNGLKPRIAPNRVSKIIRINPCPNKIRPIIEDAMKALGIL